jgi:hypothetical protein
LPGDESSSITSNDGEPLADEVLAEAEHLGGQAGDLGDQHYARSLALLEAA